VTLRTDIIDLIVQVANEQDKQLPPLSDDLKLFESGLDSLCLAIIVARLEDQLGIDPFNADEEFDWPMTVGDLIQTYERAVANKTV
jgi:acyl carrier protein